MLCKRNVSSIKRNPLVFKARMGQSIVLAVLSAAIFWQSNENNRKALQNLGGAMFFTSMATFMPGYMMTGLTFQVERPVFLREQANKMYNVYTYYGAKVLADVPGFIIAPTFFILITFFAVGYTKSVEQFFQFVLVAILNTMSGVSFGYCISTGVTNPTAAMQLAPILAMPLMLVGGLYVNQETMPFYLEVFSYISPLMYAFNSLAKLEFTNSPHDLAKVMLKNLDISRDYWTSILYLVILIVSLQFLACIFLKLLVSKFQ